MKDAGVQPSGDRSRHGSSIADAAAGWLARRDAGFALGEASAFAQWLAADARHAAEVERIERAWQAIRRPATRGGAELMMAELAQRARRRRRRRFTAAATAVGLAAMLAVAFLPRSSAPQPVAAPAALATFEVRPACQRLADGSGVELNAGAEIAAEFTPERRTVRLLRGTAHFTVQKDATRPFVVVAGPVEVRAVGTEFAVSLAASTVEVLVNEGRVAIEHSATDASAEPRAREVGEAGAGRKVILPLGDAAGHSHGPLLADLSEEALQRALAWRNQRVEFTGTPLHEAAALFNGQNRVQLSLGDETVRELRVSGIYWLNDPAGFARLVSAGFGLQIVDRGEDAIALTR